MTTAWKLPTNTASYISGVTPTQAHILFDITNNRVIFGDGSTAGGIALARATHTHIISDVTGLQTALDNKSATTHNHDSTYQPLDADLTAIAALDATTGLVEKTGANAYARRALGVGATTSVPTRADADARYAALSHGHAITDVTNLQTALNNKADASHTHTIANVTGLQTAIDGKAAASHSHVIADVTGLQMAIDGKQAADADLTAVAALATTGLAERTGVNTWATRALGTAASTSVPTLGDADGRYLQLSGGTLTSTLNISGAGLQIGGTTRISSAGAADFVGSVTVTTKSNSQYADPGIILTRLEADGSRPLNTHRTGSVAAYNGLDASYPAFSFYATEDHTSTSHGTKAVITVPPNGSLSTRNVFECDQDGSINANIGPIKVAGNTVATTSGHLQLRSYTVSTLPSATAAQLIYVSNGASNKRIAVSDGTNWRWPDGAIVS